jgi:TonB-linked SusC/RagA family outer membrane protein
MKTQNLINVSYHLTIKAFIFYIFFLSVVKLNAQTNSSEQSQVTIQLKNVALEKVLDEIEKQSQHYFLYNEKLIDVNRIVSIEVRDKRLIEVLDLLFSGTDIYYTIRDRRIILTPAEMPDLQKNYRIVGRIVDEMNFPIPGVNIIQEGTNNGTTSDKDGKYSIALSTQNTTLIYSFLGYLTEKVSTTGRSEINLTMHENILNVDEIIVTALGITQEEKALGYSVQKLRGEELTTVKGINVTTSLTGKVSGLLIQNSTEFAGIDSIQIRGKKPLIVIDGVPYNNLSLGDIPQDNIEEINILKGATALYGYRGQNGAIIVTTKKGNGLKGLSVSVNANTMFSVGFLAIPEMQSTFGRNINTIDNTVSSLAEGAWGVPMEGQVVNQWDPVSKSVKPMPYLPVGKNNFKNFLEQGIITHNNISVCNQGETGAMHSSINWIRHKGIYPNSYLNKINYTLGGNIKANNFLLESNLNYNKQISPNIGFSDYTGYDPMYTLLIWSAPDWDIRQYKDYWITPDKTQNSSYSKGNNNPYFDRYERLHSIDRDLFNGFVFCRYSFLPVISITIRSGFDLYNDYQTIRISQGSYHGAGTATVIRGGTAIWDPPFLGSYNEGLERGYSINNELFLNAGKSYKGLNFDATFGGNLFYTYDEGMQAFTQGGLSIPGFYSLNASALPIIYQTRTKKQQVNSLFGRLLFSWKDFIYLEGTLRNDWSSSFYSFQQEQLTKSFAYPSFSASLIISEFLKNQKWLSLWKMRSSWSSAKTPPTPYTIHQVYAINNSVWGDFNSARLSNSIRGINLLPESSETYEAGTMINMIKNRLSFDINYYNKRMYNFLKAAEISRMSGYKSNYVNVDDEISHRGIEVTSKINLVRTSEWNWNILLNYSKYGRYYSRLDSEFSTDKPWKQIGKRVDHILIRKFQKDQFGNIVHLSGLPLSEPYESLFGYADPDWIWGLSSLVGYKNLKLSISLDGRVGGYASSITEMYMWQSGNHPESVIPERYLDATQSGGHYIGDGVMVVSGNVSYSSDGTIIADTRQFEENNVPVNYKDYIKKIHANYIWNEPLTSFDLYNSTFFKIREVSLTYLIPFQMYKRLSIKKASVSLVGQNLFLWTKEFRYADPDSGRENFSDPSVRYLGVDFKVTF